MKAMKGHECRQKTRRKGEGKNFFSNSELNQSKLGVTQKGVTLFLAGG